MMFLPDPDDIGGVDLLLLSDLLAPIASAIGKKAREIKVANSKSKMAAQGKHV